VIPEKIVKIVYHPLMQEHYDRTPAGAPERLDTAVEILGSHPDYEFVEARPATEEEILRAHGTRTLESVKQDYDSTRPGLLYKMATLAAGGSILAGEIAAQGEPAFGLVRPPGHHASGDSYWGFCYFNNIAVSLLHLKAKGLIESAYVLDFDLHTGDGNINILGDDPMFTIYNPRGNGDEQHRAVLTITLAAQHHAASDREGFAEFELPFETIGSDVIVLVQAKGFKTMAYGTQINSERKLDKDPPYLVPEEEGRPIASWVGIMVVLILLAGVFLLSVGRSRRGGTAGRPREVVVEPPPEDDAPEGTDTAAGEPSEEEEEEEPDITEEGLDGNADMDGP